MSQSPERRPPSTAPAARGGPARPGKTRTAAGRAPERAPEQAVGPAGPPPLRLLLAAGVAGLEGLAVAVWGVTMFFTGGANAVLAGLLVLVMAALPLGAAYGLRRARRWSRGPALIMQLLALPVAWTMIKSEAWVVPAGVGVAALALGGLFLLVHPATTDALGINRRTA
ncbi:hypothetical protein OG552_24360 [Streptomyces sp. NBC_01476]|uniref:hypothetical protein n=1 Tax=Streptomyces sp. NBC_01476 TaxID=2903881 RepID=UPI002E329DAC|nr:hypothetical protein [Streptomyces sp. NBC_01476]